MGRGVSWLHPVACVLQVWFQNRRSKERRMKQLSALGARRHAFFRSPRRMRPLVDRLEPGELLPNGPFSFYGGGCAALRGARAGLGRLRWKRVAAAGASLILQLRLETWGRLGTTLGGR